MRIRSQLVVAFLLLAVLPLAILVASSYLASRRALERAVDAESREQAARMEERMKAIKSEVRRRVERIGKLPLDAFLRPGAPEVDPRVLLGRMMTEMGDAAPLVESLAVVPHPPEPPPAPRPPGDAPPGDGPASEASAVVIDVPRLYAEIEAAEAMAREVEARLMARIELNYRTRVEGEATVMELEAVTGEVAPGAPERPPHVAALHAAEIAELRALGEGFEAELEGDQGVIGEVAARFDAKRLVHRMLEQTPRDRGELPFALYRGQPVYANDEDGERLRRLDLYWDGEAGRVRALHGEGDWVISVVKDPESELVYGVARPIGPALEEIRASSWKSLGVGLGVVALALFGVLPLSRRISHGVEVVTAGAERIAQGELETRVPVRGRGEIAQLASAFNAMAEDLSKNRERLLQEEDKRREEEVSRRLLEAEYERKSRELEDAREFQLSLLPKSVPRHPALSIAVDMRTATEVGGDYYDFHHAADGSLVVAAGDATGHGAKAGTMVTVVKSLFSSHAAELGPGELLRRSAATVKGMDLGRMAMSLAVARILGSTMTLASAGMPPVLRYHGESGEVEEIAVPGMPLGGLDADYRERRVELLAGDVLLFSSDGLPELLNGDGELFGYDRMAAAFAAVAAGGAAPRAIVAELAATAERWTGGAPPADDVTFVVIRVEEGAGGGSP